MISVVIPVYNVEKYLGQCLESVFKLKSDIEIVLVDDGSTDNSGNLCDVYANEDCRVKVVHQKNAGLSAARNTGVLNCSGEYIMFLDSDDFINPLETDIMLSNLGCEPEVLVGLYNNYFTNSNKYVPENTGNILGLKGFIQINNFLEAIPTDGREFYMTAWRFVVRRSFVLKNDLFFTPGIYHEDEEWTMRLISKVNNIFVTHSHFYNYRQAREGAITSVVNAKHIFDTFKIIEKAYLLLEIEVLSNEQKQYIQHRIANLYLNDMMHLYSLNGAERERAYILLYKYYHTAINNLTGKIGSVVKLTEAILGLRVTCLILYIVRNIRNIMKR